MAVEAVASPSGRPKTRNAEWSDAWQVRITSNPRSMQLSAHAPLQTFDLKESLSDRFARVPCQRKALILGLAGGGGVFFLRLFTSRREPLSDSILPAQSDSPLQVCRRR